MLKLFYITNNPEVAEIADSAGVDRIFIDMEYLGKEKRQPNMDTVKNHHTVDDVKRVKAVLNSSELLVRVNPVNSRSEKEIDEVINAGADYIMLPMWKSVDEVKQFISYVNGRAKTMLLLETDEAVKCLDGVLSLKGIDEIHIGLNDLHLSQGKKFLFELLVDGTVDDIANKIKTAGLPFGIGGVGAVGVSSPLPAENIIAEHYRLGSSMAILSRAFCNSSNMDIDEVKKLFSKRLNANKKYEERLENENKEFFYENHLRTAEIIKGIVG